MPIMDGGDDLELMASATGLAAFGTRLRYQDIQSVGILGLGSIKARFRGRLGFRF